MRQGRSSCRAQLALYGSLPKRLHAADPDGQKASRKQCRKGRTLPMVMPRQPHGPSGKDKPQPNLGAFAKP
jgi:hypothetical protein